MGCGSLAAPRARRGPAIDLHWNLAQGDYAYLNYVPVAVEAYQKRVSALPGFWQVMSLSVALELGADINPRAPGLPLTMITKSDNVITVSDQSDGNGARNRCWRGCYHREFELNWSRTS